MSVGGRRDGSAAAISIGDLGGRPVAFFRLEGGKHRGAIGPTEGEALARIVLLATEQGMPIVGVMATSGADVHEGVASLHGWGTVARALTEASGQVPIVFAVTGPAVSGPALILGLADFVVMSADAFAYVSGPDGVLAFTGIAIGASALGGASVHAHRTGLAALVAQDEEDCLAALEDLLGYLPSNHMDDPPMVECDDPSDRLCHVASETVPSSASSSYDMRRLVGDVVDEGSFLEVQELHAPNIVTAFARLGGRAIGVIANQPCQRAGTLDIEASRKAAAFVQCCDAFNVPLVTFVDTPGFEPGKSLEWRGMIRHGAELVHAYAASTVPRLCVVIRKAYGGAYIVMDSKNLGNDLCFAWPTAEIAVMGAPGAVQILSSRRLEKIADPAQRERARADLIADYEERFCSPEIAAQRGYVDDVIDPRDTRSVLIRALESLSTKRDRPSRAKHTNAPL